MTCDIWWTFSQNFRQCFEDWEEKDDLGIESINDNSVGRTALVTPKVLTIMTIICLVVITPYVGHSTKMRGTIRKGLKKRDFYQHFVGYQPIRLIYVIFLYHFKMSKQDMERGNGLTMWIGIFDLYLEALLRAFFAISLVVAMFVCCCCSLFVPFQCDFFRGLSLALWSHDQVEASHWPSYHMISSRQTKNTNTLTQ